MSSITSYLQDQLNIIDNNRLEQIPVERILRVTIPLYGAILQRKSFTVERQKLLAIVGEPLKAVVSDIIDIQFTDLGFIANANSSAFQYTQEALNDIVAFFDNPENGFNFLKPVPYFPRVTGEKLIEYINLIEYISPSTLASYFADALRAALPGVTATTIDEQMPGVRLIAGPKNGIKETWKFVLAVSPNQSALPTAFINDFANKLVVQRAKVEAENKLSDLNILVIAPVTEDRNALENIDDLNRIRVYHLWTLQTLRFFNLLSSAITGQEQVAAENFLSIFPPEIATPISAKKAIDRLKKKFSE